MEANGASNSPRPMRGGSMISVTVSTVGACGLVGFGCTAGASFSLDSPPRGLTPDRDDENDLASLKGPTARRSLHRVQATHMP